MDQPSPNRDLPNFLRSSLTEDDHELEDEPGEEEGALVELDAEHDEDVGQDADGVEHQQNGEHHVEGRPETMYHSGGY